MAKPSAISTESRKRPLPRLPRRPGSRRAESWAYLLSPSLLHPVGLESSGTVVCQPKMSQKGSCLPPLVHVVGTLPPSPNHAQDESMADGAPQRRRAAARTNPGVRTSQPGVGHPHRSDRSQTSELTRGSAWLIPLTLQILVDYS